MSVFGSPFIQISDLLSNIPDSNYSELYTATTLMRFVVKKIKEPHLKLLIEEALLPVIFRYLFVQNVPATDEKDELGYELLGLKTIVQQLMDTKELLNKQDIELMHLREMKFQENKSKQIVNKLVDFYRKST